MKNYLTSAILGLITAIIGVFVMGFLMAIAIPEVYFNWFRQYLSIWVGLTIIDIYYSAIAFGISGIFSGIIIGKFMNNNWAINVLVYYIAFLLYISCEIFGFFSDQPFSFQILPYLKQTYGLPYLVLPFCVFLSAYISRKRSLVLSD